MAIDELLDKHIAHARQRLKAIRDLDLQWVALRPRCDVETSHDCAILASFMNIPNVLKDECCFSQCRGDVSPAPETVCVAQ